MLGRVGKPRGQLAGRGFRPTFPLKCTMPQCWCLLCFPWVPAQALSALSGALPAACWRLRSGCRCLSRVKEAGRLHFLPVKRFGALLQLSHLSWGAGVLLTPQGLAVSCGLGLRSVRMFPWSHSRHASCCCRTGAPRQENAKDLTPGVA